MTTLAPYRSDRQAGRDGMAQLLRAEWTKLRTVRGWMIALVVAALLTVLLGLLFATGSRSSCSNGPVEVACPAVPVGPGGEAVDDKFFFVHRPLAGDGAITVRLTSMTGVITYPPPDHDKIIPGMVPWAKAGIIVKDGTRQGSTYAAMMLTGAHGVRMQHDFTHDTAGRPGGVSATSPRWLRLTRSGDTLTGYESADGTHWSKVGTAQLAGLPATVQIGLFVASPGDLTVKANSLGGVIEQMRLATVTAVFDQVSLQGTAPGGAWTRDDIGAAAGDGPGGIHHPGGVKESGGTYTVTGHGDIAPSSDGTTLEATLTGAMISLIVVIVVAVMFITAEYRRGLIRTTLLASPRRGRALAAKAIVIGVAAFVAGLAAVLVTVPLGTHILGANGNHVLPVSSLTEARVFAGAAALFAVTAVFALALGALFRRSVVAVITAITLIVLPYILATASVLPEGLSEWLLRLTPAAGFAVLQSIPEYPQVIGHYAPSAGYYPLAPWAGFAVFCGYAALALGLAARRLHRRDA
ncbi:ABC transporter permease subunit [Actinomadura scrupuli]|uniref:ABC transporter permease subunit n=1 Tax=Actinomadura scrupuli TaxID=559629 RepID=UPI003D95254C